MDAGTIAEWFPKDLISHLPHDLTPLQTEILENLVKYGYSPHLGPLPNTIPGRKSSSPCVICLDNIDDGIMMQHSFIPRERGERPGTARPCLRPFHLSCLLTWAEGGVYAASPLTCPQCRSRTIPYTNIIDMYYQFNLRSIPTRHRIRPLTELSTFWQGLVPGWDDGGMYGYSIGYWSVPEILEHATKGIDVGFITSAAVAKLPFDPVGRRVAARYLDQQVPIPLSRRGPLQKTESAYSIWVYADCELNDEFALDEEQIEDGLESETRIIMLVPFLTEDIVVFRRYLLAILGQCNLVDIDENDQPQVEINRLSDNEVISMNAEWQVRKLMLQTRAVWGTPRTATWFWPFQNHGGGLVMGGLLPDDPPYAARGYALSGYNLGWSNDARFAQLSIDPNSNAVARSERLIQRFREGRLPDLFPIGHDLPPWQYGTQSTDPSPTHPLVVPNARLLFPVAQPTQPYVLDPATQFTFTYPVPPHTSPQPPTAS